MLRFHCNRVNVIIESSFENAAFRRMFSDYDHLPRITFDQLYDTLAHGAPGDYILVWERRSDAR